MKARSISISRRLFVLSALVIFAGGGCTAASAQTIDPHLLYEQNCGGCHAPHAGDFVHDSLVRSNGHVQGRKSCQELRAFLQSGHGNLSIDEIGAMVRHLTDIQRSGRLFHDKCKICHGRAVVFARDELLLKDGKLTGRYSKRNIEQFLPGHGRLNADEVPGMIEVLKRHLNTRSD